MKFLVLLGILTTVHTFHQECSL
nr:orf8 protein [Pangolin coronavirus]